MLRLSGVGRTFPGPPEVEALVAVELEVADGEFLAIVGPSGGGKSTLLNILGLLDAPTTGGYDVAGSATSGMSPADVARLRSDMFGFVFQGFHLLDRRPVLDSVELPLIYRAVPASVRRRRARDALGRLGIEHLAETPAVRLSGGQRQRVAIARALATGTPVLIADEPTGNLDTANGERVVEAMRELRGQGVTIVLVTHDPDVAAAADRRVAIRDGRLSHPSPSPAFAATHSPPPAPPGSASRVRLRDLLADAASSIWSQRARTAGSAVAVGVAVALAVGAFAITATARAQVSDRFDAHANREVSASWSPGESRFRPADIPLLTTLGTLSGVESVAIVDELGGHPVESVPGRPGLVAPVYAASGDLIEAARLGVSEKPKAESFVLMGENLAGQLELPPFPSGAVVLVDGTPAVVSGIIRSSPRIPQLLGSLVWVGQPPPFAQSSRRVALIRTSSGAARQVAGQVAVAIDPAAPGAVEVDAPADPSTLRAEIEGDVLLVLAGFTVLAVLAALAALANAMATSVSERRAEIGLRVAVGARLRHLVGLILMESAMIGMAGGIVGLLAGLAATLVLTATQGWIPVFEPTLAPLAVAGGIAIGASSGTFAARRAARIPPGEALRS